MNNEKPSTCDIACVGNITEDTLLYVERLPPLDGVSFVTEVTRCLGGRGAIPAFVAAALGSKTALLTAIGMNAKTELLEPLSAAGVDTTCIERQGDGESYFEAIAAISKNDENSVTYFVPKKIPMTVSPRHEARARAARVVYFSTHKRSFNLCLLEAVRTSGSIVIHNLSRYLFTDGKYREAALERSEILIGNEYEYSELLRDCDCTDQGLFRLYPRVGVVVVTLGARGVKAIRPGRESTHVAAIAARVRTPLGAGDAFAGGFIHAIAQGHAVEKGLATGVRTAAASIRAGRTLPDLGELRMIRKDSLENESS